MTRFGRWLRAISIDESGQGTVEYFLVILASSALAIIALNWLNSGSGGGLLGDLFSNVIGWVLGRF